MHFGGASEELGVFNRSRHGNALRYSRLQYPHPRLLRRHCAWLPSFIHPYAWSTHSLEYLQHLLQSNWRNVSSLEESNYWNHMWEREKNDGLNPRLSNANQASSLLWVHARPVRLLPAGLVHASVLLGHSWRVLFDLYKCRRVSASSAEIYLRRTELVPSHLQHMLAQCEKEHRLIWQASPRCLCVLKIEDSSWQEGWDEADLAVLGSWDCYHCCHSVRITAVEQYAAVKPAVHPGAPSWQNL